MILKLKWTIIIGKTTYQSNIIKLIYFAIIKIEYIFVLKQNLKNYETINQRNLNFYL